MRRHLVIFLRAPELGRGKTRLAAGIGRIGALHFQRTSSARLIKSLAGDDRWTTWLSVTPDASALRPRPWPGGGIMVPQGGGDLGARMGRVLGGLTGQVVIIGSDLPDLSRGDIWSAFRALNRRDLVLGPAEDGGYWLIGARQALRVAPLFDGVRWSTEHTRADTIANLPEGRRVALLDERLDVDAQADLARWRAASMRPFY